MQISGYLSIARRWWLVLLVSAALAGLAGYLVASVTPPTYEARVRLLVGTQANIDNQRAGAQLVPTYAELATSVPLLETAAATVGQSLDDGSRLEEFRRKIKVSGNVETRILTVEVVDTDAAQATAIADALAEQVQALGSGQGEDQVQVGLVDRLPAGEAVGPRVPVIVGLATLAGLVGALLLVIVAEYASSTVRTATDLTNASGLQLVGAIKGPIESIHVNPSAVSTDAYRAVATRIGLLGTKQPTRTVLVVGAAASEPSGFVAANLATLCALAGRDAVVVDGNPERVVTSLFGASDKAGLGDILARLGESTVRPSERTGHLRVLPGGNVPYSDALDETQARRLLDELSEGGATVVIDAAPVQESSSALTWAGVVDVVLLVTRGSTVDRGDVIAAAEAVASASPTRTGAIFLQPVRTRAWRRLRGRTPATGPTAEVVQVREAVPVPDKGVQPSYER